MWARNLLFWSICGGATLAIAANLFPPRLPGQGGAPALRSDPAGKIAPVVQALDECFEHQWDAAGLVPSGRADSLTVARRLSLALCGTIPSLEEIRQFQAQSEPQRVAWYTGRLLEDRRFSDYWAERFARALVGVEDGPFLVYRRRRFVSWLSDQLYANRPYDELTRELITAEGLWTDAPATNFLTVTIAPNADDKAPDPIKLAARTSRALLGVRLDCVQCHDDFLGGRWQQTDFQGLAAFYAQADQSFTGVYDGQREFEVEVPVERPQSSSKAPASEALAAAAMSGDSDDGEEISTLVKRPVEPCLPFAKDVPLGEGTRREQLAAWVTHLDNKAFARATVNRVWALMFGRPLVAPIDNIPLDESQLPPALVLLAEDFSHHGYDLRRLIHTIAASQVFQLDSRLNGTTSPVSGSRGISTEHERHWAVFRLTRLRPEQVVGSLVQSASLQTLDHDSHIITRLLRAGEKSDFLKRYGDTGEDEFGDHIGTIPQRLVLLNGDLVKDRTSENLVANAATRIARLAPDDETAVETAFLAVLTERPSPALRAMLAEQLDGATGPERARQLEDLYWSLLNTWMFSWNH